MLSETKDRVNFLKQVLIFNEFTDEQLEQVANLMGAEFIKSGQTVFEQGDDRDNLYFVTKGEVRVYRTEEDGAETFLSAFDYGDTFGEDALIHKRQRSATIVATSNTDLLYLNEEKFDWLRKTFPQVEPYLDAFTRTHEAVRRLKIGWLAPEETISLVARRHPLRLIEEITVTFFILSVVLAATVGAIAFFQSSILVYVSAGIGGLVSLIGITASVWSYFEWKNDYFFVTNLRVVWRERIIFRSASQQEVPLRTIQSLRIQSLNFLARSFGVGDLIVKTFNSQLTLTDVNHPDRMKSMIEAFIGKERNKSRRVKHESIRRAVRQSIGVKAEAPAIKAPPPAAEERIERLAIFKSRIVEKDRITYRKHWILFLVRAWQPTGAFLLSIIVSLWLTPILLNSDFGLWGLAGIYFIPFGMALWWFYQYEDWRNDIYQITKNQIVDREKKPLGQEITDTASIDRIQSVRHEIPNTLYLLLNVGHVKIDVGDKTLTFDGVHDPSLVHSDISRKMEEYNLAAEQKRLDQEHNAMAEWIKIYHEESRNQQEEAAKKVADRDDGPDRW